MLLKRNYFFRALSFFSPMLNQLINVFWTIVSFAAVGFYWRVYITEKGSRWTLYVIIILSILFSIIPGKWLSALTLSSNRKTYERIGVRIVLWFVQNGTFVNRIQRKPASQKGLITNRRSALVYLKTIDMQERYHYCCFVFFTLSAFSALSFAKTEFALFISLSNIIYNVYPILVQQYNRLRINSVISRSTTSNDFVPNKL